MANGRLYKLVVKVSCNNCLFCVNDIIEYWTMNKYRQWILVEGYAPYCLKTYARVHSFKYKCCELYVDRLNTKLEVQNMRVEIKPEVERVDLKSLPTKQTLIAVSEKMVEDVRDQFQKVIKTGGLEITFRQTDGRIFPQKYTKTTQQALFKALVSFGIEDTTELKSRYFIYMLMPMGRGVFPRYCPIETTNAPETVTPVVEAKKGKK